jgi:hypothetical protein
LQIKVRGWKSAIPTQIFSAVKDPLYLQHVPRFTLVDPTTDRLQRPKRESEEHPVVYVAEGRKRNKDTDNSQSIHMA